MHFPCCWERCWSQGDRLDNLPAFLEGFSPKAFKELGCCRIRGQILILELIPRQGMKDGTILSPLVGALCAGAGTSSPSFRRDERVHGRKILQMLLNAQFLAPWFLGCGEQLLQVCSGSLGLHGPDPT